MQAAVDEVAREIYGIRPFPGSIGKNEGDVEFAQEIKKRGNQKAWVTNFDAITHRPLSLGFEPCMRRQLGIMMAAKRRGFAGGFWQQLEKLTETRLIPSQVRRKLR